MPIYKGITLLELLIILLILSSLAVNTVPLWNSLNDSFILAREQNKLRLFLRQIQYQSTISNEVWLILVNRQLEQQHWCITAQIKNTYLCDCLSPQYCPENVSAYFYYPYFSQRSMISTTQYYPNEISRFSGIRQTFSTTCLLLQVGTKQTLFSLFNVGSIRLKENDNMSACGKEDI